MGERLLGGDPGEVGAAAEGPARGGQDEPLDRARRLGADQLVERRVLGVDRDDPRAGRLGERHDQLAADHQALLVGEREVDALGERDDRRAEAGGADDRVEDQVGLGARAISSRMPSSPASTWPPHAAAARSAALRVGERDRRHAVLARPARAAAPSSSPRESPTTCRLVAGRDHLERLRADRPGRAEYQHALHGAQCRCRPKRAVKRPSARNEDGRPEGLPSSARSAYPLALANLRPPRARTAGPSGRPQVSLQATREGVLAALRRW